MSLYWTLLDIDHNLRVSRTGSSRDLLREPAAPFGIGQPVQPDPVHCHEPVRVTQSVAWAVPFRVGHVGNHCVRADQGARERMPIPIDGIGHRYRRQGEGQRSDEIDGPPATSCLVSRGPAATGRTHKGHRIRLCPK